MRDALAKAGDAQAGRQRTRSARSAEREAQVNTLTADQSRIRENIKTVDKSSAYATRLLKKLDDQESQIEKLRPETDTLRTKLDEQNRALADYLNGLNVG